MATREELEIILKARNEASAAFTALDKQLKDFSKSAKDTSEQAKKLSVSSAQVADSIGRVATKIASSASAFGLPAEAFRAIDDAADVAELGLKGVEGGFKGAVTGATAFSAATLGAVGAAAALGLAIGGWLNKFQSVRDAADRVTFALMGMSKEANAARAAGPAGFDQGKIAAGYAQAQKAYVDALKASGQSAAEIGTIFKKTYGTEIPEAMKTSVAAWEQAREAAKAFAEEVQQAVAHFKGADLAAEAKKISAALAQLGPVTAISDRRLVELGDEMVKLADAGQEIPGLTAVFTELAIRGLDPAAKAARGLGDAIGPLKSAVGTFAGLQNVIPGAEAPVQFGDVSVNLLEEAKEKTEQVEEATFDWAQQLQNVANQFQALGSAGGILSSILGGISGIGSALKGVGGLGGLGDLLKGGKGFEGIIAGASTAMQIAGAAISVGKTIIGAFTKSDAEKAGEIAGRVLGMAVSKGLAEAISKTSKELGIAKEAASLLHLGEAMDESGESAATFADEMSTMLEGIELGAIPARAGIEAMGEAFGKLAEEAEAGSVAAMASMGALARQAKQFGIEVPEITAAVAAAVQKSVGALGGLGGIKIVSEADAKAQASIFLNVFNSVLATEGIVAAAQAIGPAIKTFQEQLAAAGIGRGATDAILGPVRSAMSLLKNDMTKGGAEGAQALKTILEGQLKAGFLDVNTFGAIQQQAKTAFDQMIKGGADTGAALQAVAPLLAQMQQTAAATGQALDPVTQQMIEQAKVAGLAFPVDTGTQMVDLLKELVTVMGGALPASVQTAATSMSSISGSTAAAAASASSSLASISTTAISTSSTVVQAFGGVGEQITSAIQPAANAVQQGFVSAFDAASQGASSFVAQLSAIAGKEIGLNFKFGGGFAGGPDSIPAFQHGGFVPEGGRGGRLVRVAERGTGGEHMVPARQMKDLIAALHVLASSRSSGAALYIDGRKFADEMRRVDRRRTRGWRSSSD